jgi:5-methyltetrahydrofolate--homocysteine methyltransferase
MSRVENALRSGRVLVADGAWGTELMRRGLRLGECPERWCVERPDAVREVALRYVEAGADVVGTNSFGGSPLKLDLFGLAGRAAEINEAAAALSREAAGPDRFVFGSVGPSGKLLMTGDVTEEALFDSFRGQIEALVRGGVDAICIETMMDLDEARVAVRAAVEQAGVPAAATFTFTRGAGGAYHTAMGVSPAQAAGAMREAGARIVGANCGHGIEDMVGIAEEMHRVVPGVPLLVQANAGLPVNESGIDVYPDTPERMAERVPDLMAAGVKIIGGCCGTRPEHVRALAEAVERCRTR